jgi:hypothetical protein
MGGDMRQGFNDYEWHGDGVVMAQCLKAFGKSGMRLDSG